MGINVISSNSQTSGTEAYLVALDSSFSNREYVISESDLIIGRDKQDSDIILSEKTISRKHSLLRRKDDEFVFIDLQSTNGSFINQQSVFQQTTLHDGDIISLGSPTSRHFRFQLQSNREEAATFQLAPQQHWIIGRDRQSDICLSSDPTVSSAHARVILRKHGLYLEDLTSLNGTYLNGEKVQKAKILPGDTIVVGSTSFHFHLSDSKALLVSQREYSDSIQLESICLQRQVACGGGRNKKILHDINLQVLPGEFVGILGPSGAGKSTLLKTLCGYAAPTSGCVLLNETPLYRSYEMFRRIIGYVPQDDILHSELDVFRSLDYIARQRLPADTTIDERKKIILTTIEELGLSHVCKNKISQLSGGQRKRVSIGAELITRPSILFLDEPTSGLDPSVEERLMNHFQYMAGQGTTILITTHILYNLSLLDKIIFMSQGRLIFFGTPKESLRFFNAHGVNLAKPTQIFDLLEGLLDFPLDNETGTENDKKEEIADYFAKKYLESQFFRKYIEQKMSPLAGKMLSECSSDLCKRKSSQDTSIRAIIDSPSIRRFTFGRLKKFFSMRQWLILSSRQLHLKFSSVKQSLIYLVIPVILAMVTLTQSINGFPDQKVMLKNRHEIHSMLHQAGQTTERTIQALLSPQKSDEAQSATSLIYALKYEGVVNLPMPMGLLIMFVMTSIFMGTFIACQEISSEKIIRFREHMAGQRVLDYLGSKLSFCLSITFVQSIVYFSICYIGSGVYEMPFFIVLFVLVLLSWTAVAMGLFLSAIDRSSGEFAIILTIIFVLPQLILSGGLGPDFYLHMNHLAKVIATLFPAKWGVELLLTAIYKYGSGDNIPWIREFISNTLGFNFGIKAMSLNISVLFGQMVTWVFLAGWLIVRRERV